MLSAPLLNSTVPKSARFVSIVVVPTACSVRLSADLPVTVCPAVAVMFAAELRISVPEAALFCPPLPVLFAEKSYPFVIVMSPVLVWTVTLPPVSAESSVCQLNVAADPPGLGTNGLLLVICESDPVPVLTSEILSGSRSRVPAVPFGARVETKPAYSSDCLPDTSTKPPLPASEPPSALMLPK